MTISHRAQVQNQLHDPDTPVSAGLRALLVLADEQGDAVTAAWARQELDGYPADRIPDYRKITAPIYGMAMRQAARSTAGSSSPTCPRRTGRRSAGATPRSACTRTSPPSNR